MRMLTATLAIAATITLLTGCAAAAPPASDPGGGASQGTTGAAADPGAAGPVPLIDLSCAGLLDAAALAAAYDPAPVEVPLSFEGSGGYYPLSQQGLAQAGALRCEYSDGGGLSTEHYAQISVLPDAADDWAALVSEIQLFQPQTPGYGDDARQTCTDGAYVSCRVDILVGDRWINAVLGGLRGTDAAGPLVEAVVAAVSAADPVAPTWSPATAAPESCEALATAAELSEAVGVTLGPLERFAAPTQPVIYHGGFVAAGGMLCGWANDFSSASAMTVDVALLPGGAWAWDGYWAPPPAERIARERVPGLGDDAWAGCTGDQVCWASVRVGDDWLDVAVNDESSADETAVAIGIAEAIVARR